MYKFHPLMCVVDDLPDTRAALAFARRHPGRVKLCHYGNSMQSRDIIDHGERITADRTNWLDLAIGRFINHTIKLPVDIPFQYIDHIKAVVRVPKRDAEGNIVVRYHKTGPDHYAMARNYSEMALRVGMTSGQSIPITTRVI